MSFNLKNRSSLWIIGYWNFSSSNNPCKKIQTSFWPNVYANASLEEETVRLWSFSSGDKLYRFVREFSGSRGLPKFFSKQMYSFSQNFFDQGFDLVYNDEFFLLPHSKLNMFEFIAQLHQFWQLSIPKNVARTSFDMLITVKMLEREIESQTFKPIHSEVVAIHKPKTPTSKCQWMRFVGSMKFYSIIIQKFRQLLKTFLLFCMMKLLLKGPQNYTCFSKKLTYSLHKMQNFLYQTKLSPLHYTITLIHWPTCCFTSTKRLKYEKQKRNFSKTSVMLRIKKITTRDIKKLFNYFSFNYFWFCHYWFIFSYHSRYSP